MQTPFVLPKQCCSGPDQAYKRQIESCIQSFLSLSSAACACNIVVCAPASLFVHACRSICAFVLWRLYSRHNGCLRKFALREISFRRTDGWSTNSSDKCIKKADVACPRAEGCDIAYHQSDAQPDMFGMCYPHHSSRADRFLPSV